MRPIAVFVLTVLLGMMFTAGVLMPAIVCMDMKAEMPDADGGKDILWLCPVFDNDGTVTDHIATLTPTGITRDMYEDAWHDTPMARMQFNDYGYNVPDCPGTVIDGLDASLERNGIDMDHLNDREKVIVIQAFVMNGIFYEEDRELYGCTDYAASPTETLYLRKGDCEDVSILFVSIARAYSIKSTLLLMDGHCMAGVVLDGYPNYLGGYTPIECTHYPYGVKRPMSYPEAEDGFRRAADGGLADTVTNLWLRYCYDTSGINPILYIARMLS